MEKKYFSIDLPEDKKFLANNCTLLHKFEVSGFNYEASKWDKNLSYRDIEKTLILFQTSFTETLSPEQVELILQELQKKMDVDPITKKERNRKKFIHILHWLAMKICLHNCCQDLNKRLINDPISYIEESILWNCAAYSYKSDPSAIPEKFMNYVKNEWGNSFDKKKNLVILENFLRKIIPHLTKGEFDELLKEYDSKIMKSEYIDLNDVSKIIQPLLAFKMERTLKNYISRCYSQFKTNLPRSDFSNEIKLLDRLRTPPSKKNNSETKNYEIINEIHSDEESSPSKLNYSQQRFKALDDKNILKSYFLLENFFEKYSYMNKNKPKPSNSYGDEDETIRATVDQMFDPSKRKQKLLPHELVARAADQRIADLYQRKKREKSWEAKTKNQKNMVLERMDSNILLMQFKEQEEFEFEDDKKEREKNEKHYLRSGFSMQEILEHEPQKIRSMVSLENGEDVEKMKIDLLLSKNMKKRMKRKTGKDKSFWETCSERTTQACKCEIF